MECNKDEATRAKEIAEKKLAAKDISGAKKFALKAQNLYPGLEGIPQLIAILDVYVSAENKVSGESDWYGILGVSPQADDETVRKHYRKLALMLHPDKNKSVGADGAFKLISEAWSLLSDKTKRVAYDQKRNIKLYQKVPSAPSGVSSTTPGSNGFYNFSKPSAKSHKSTAKPGRPSAPAPPPSHKSKPNTFWTVCHQCKMQYEYLRVYLNHKLLCPNCQEPFLAVETAPPPLNGTKSWNFSQQRHNQAAGKNTANSGRNNMSSTNTGTGGFNGSDSHNQTNFQWGSFSKAGGASSAAQAASVVQQAYEKVKREREETLAATKREEALKRKNASKRMGGLSSSGYAYPAKRRKGMEDVGPSNFGSYTTNQVAAGSGGASMANAPGTRQFNFETVRVNGIPKPYGMRDFVVFNLQDLLMVKARKEIHNKLKEWLSATVAKSAARESVGSEKVIDTREKNFTKADTLNQDNSGDAGDKETGVGDLNSSRGMPDAKPDAETKGSLSINVPDADFHDFDKDRTERCFGESQVWAAYDDDDGMPRFYAMIHNVISLNPFKMRISWLNSKTNSELGPLNWIGSGFSKTCGDFRVGKYEIYNSLNSFSHKVRWAKGTRGVIHIYPKKGDVWALYRNWSADWNELTADEVMHKYDMVEVLEDFSEEVGVTVTPLVKVAGFKTVFHQHLDPREVRRIPKEEMFRFSHHVPSYLLTGQEGPNAPKGCRELDPAATPSELLQVIIDAKEEEIVENGSRSEEEEKVGDAVEKGNDK